MTWTVTIGDDGSITLPAELIDKLGWTSETLLRWQTDDKGAHLAVTLETDELSTG